MLWKVYNPLFLPLVLSCFRSQRHVLMNCNTIPFLPFSWAFSPQRGGEILSLKVTPRTSQPFGSAWIGAASHFPVVLGGLGVLASLKMMESHSEMLATQHGSSHFLFLPANSKSSLRSCDIAIFGTDPFGRKCPNWIYSHVPSPYIHQSSLAFPWLCGDPVAPLHQHFTFSSVFLIHSEYLEPAHPFLSSPSVSGTLISTSLALHLFHQLLA